MLISIVTHTPLWVWAVLAFFIYRGLAARYDREASWRTLIALPLILTAIAFQGAVARFGLSFETVAVWLLGIVVGGCLGGFVVPARSLRGSAKGIWLCGSWMPLVLILAVFVTKYATEVLFAIRPEWMQLASVSVGICLLYGMLSGVFLGRPLPVLRQYRFLRANHLAVG